jgi:hypothetical protein
VRGRAVRTDARRMPAPPSESDAARRVVSLGAYSSSQALPDVVAADVRKIGGLQNGLQTPVLTELAVSDGEYNIRACERFGLEQS